MAGIVYLPHQRQAIEQLRSGSILCAGVGTGKSITALGYFFEKVCGAVEWSDGVCRGPLLSPVPLYIITTARKRDTKEWDKEFDKFGLGRSSYSTNSAWLETANGCASSTESLMPTNGSF